MLRFCKRSPFISP